MRRIGYRVGGLPIAARALLSRGNIAEIRLRRAYAKRYFQIRSPAELTELIVGVAVAPLVVIALIALFTVRNGRLAARRADRAILLQVTDQLRLYLGAGVLAPWYYIFELNRQPTVRHARSFAYRWETKGGVYHVLREAWRPPTSPLSDKVAFAEFCGACELPTPAVLAVIRPDRFDLKAPAEALRCDLFVKRIEGRGGKGAQRWDYRDGLYCTATGERLSLPELLVRLRSDARHSPLLVQRRLTNPPELRELANGALSTVRILTCLDGEEPRIVAAAARMAIGGNHVVDNLHCGGIAVGIDLDTGALGLASNLGADSSLGWISHHPGTHARIAGRTYPMWHEACRLALRAHHCFGDRIIIGWDIAITEDGPVIVEGNGSPDLDIAQRFGPSGLMDGRFAACLANRLEPFGGPLAART